MKQKRLAAKAHARVFVGGLQQLGRQGTASIFRGGTGTTVAATAAQAGEEQVEREVLRKVEEMEPSVSIEGAQMIRVAVVGVGAIPTAQFREYVALVLRHRCVELKSASSFYKEHQKSPFAHEPWETGSLHFKFLVGGSPKSPWEDFQANRRCLGVVGLLHCPTSTDIGTAYDHFLAICRAYPSAQEKRCFAFFPREDQIELDDKRRQHLVVFPPDRQMVEYQMQTLMQDFAASLLMAFESWVLHADPVGAILTTPLDSQASLNSEEISKAKKRRLGRVQKTIGDYCLLAGSPVDANAHYTTAIELAKLTGDLFWHAGAVEGYVSALVVDRAGVRDQELEDEVKFRYVEVIQLYHRERAMSFELEATLKLARFLCRCAFSLARLRLFSSSSRSMRVESFGSFGSFGARIAQLELATLSEAISWS